MIIDRIENAKRYQELHPLFSESFTFLESIDLKAFPNEKKELRGEKLFALFFNGKGSGTSHPKLEAHKRYIDIHFVLEGMDLFAYRNTTQCENVHSAYNEKDDYVLFSDEPSGFFPIKAGGFVIVFPEDAHAPATGTEEVKKVVLKVAI